MPRNAFGFEEQYPPPPSHFRAPLTMRNPAMSTIRDCFGRTYGDPLGALAVRQNPFTAAMAGPRDATPNLKIGTGQGLPLQLQPQSVRTFGVVSNPSYGSPGARGYGADPGTFRSTNAQDMTAAVDPQAAAWLQYAQQNASKPAGGWSQAVAGAAQPGGLLSTIAGSLFGGKSAQAATPSYPAPQTQAVYPPPAASTSSWVGPAVLVGGLGLLGAAVYAMTR